MTTIKLFIEQLSQTIKVHNQRQVVVLAGDEQWAIAELSNILSPELTYWLGQGDWSSCLPINQAKSLLGNECQHLVFNCYSGLNPDAFGAISGTLFGGGICFLITPSFKQWPQFSDPDYVRYVATKAQVDRVSANFIRRTISLITDDRHCHVITADGDLPIIKAMTHVKPSIQSAAPYASDDQQDTVAEIIKTISGHRRRPLVISADRGRGKSAALGIAAAQLLTTKLSDITVTAPSVAAVQCLFKHAAALLDGAVIDKLGVSWGDKRISFIAPDQLIATLPECQLLLVDEAAAIPTPMLATIAKHYARLVFATTIHGYEGTGRGFALRFVKQLREIAPSYRKISLIQPIRWAIDDPFEHFTFNLLGLNSEASNVDSLVGSLVNGKLTSALSFSIISQQQLLSAPELLQQLFGLLVLAHYQTSPSDFRQLLDAPDLTIFIATIDGRLVATALVLNEGELSSKLQQQIWQGTRRLRGHLIPQSLISQLGLKQAGGYRYGRIMRIAVQPQLHHCGIGRGLDQYIEQWAINQQLDFMGASFGATTPLTSYWQALNYQTLRLGINRDSASGTHSVIVLKTVTNKSDTNELIGLGQSSFYQGLRYALSAEFKALEFEMVVCLLKQLSVKPQLSAQDHLNITIFVETNRPFELVAWSIANLLWRLGDRLSLLSQSQQQVLINKVLQQQAWSTCVESGQHHGRKDAESLLKQAVKALYMLCE